MKFSRDRDSPCKGVLRCYSRGAFKSVGVNLSWGEVQKDEEETLSENRVTSISNVSCQDVMLPKGFGMKNKSQSWVCSVYYRSKCGMEAEKRKNNKEKVLTDLTVSVRSNLYFNNKEIYSFPTRFPCSSFHSIATNLLPFTCVASSEAR